MVSGKDSCFIPSSLVGWACQWMWNTQSLQYSRLIPKDATEFQVTLRTALRNKRNNEKIFFFLFYPSCLPVSLFFSPSFPLSLSFSLSSLSPSLSTSTSHSLLCTFLSLISYFYYIFFTLHGLKMWTKKALVLRARCHFFPQKCRIRKCES